MRHPCVYLTSELDKASRYFVFPGLPGEIKRIDWNAMAAEAWPRIEWHKAEGLALGGFDDFPHINAHWFEYHFEFVNQRNVNSSKNVFGQLHRFCSFCGRNRHNRLHN